MFKGTDPGNSLANAAGQTVAQVGTTRDEMSGEGRDLGWPERAAGLVSAKTAALMEGVLSIMHLNKRKLPAVILLITCIGVGVLTHLVLAARPNEAARVKAMGENPAATPQPAAKDEAMPTLIPAGDIART